jgi:hypothetical protein
VKRLPSCTRPTNPQPIETSSIARSFAARRQLDGDDRLAVVQLASENRRLEHGERILHDLVALAPGLVELLQPLRALRRRLRALAFGLLAQVRRMFSVVAGELAGSSGTPSTAIRRFHVRPGVAEGCTSNVRIGPVVTLPSRETLMSRRCSM